MSAFRSGEVNPRPALVIVSNEQTPYRLHFHRRIVREIPEVNLCSVFTHELASSPWKYQAAAEINPILFGSGDSSKNQSRVASSVREWRKGGQIIRWMARFRSAAVLVLGYNDAGRLRIISWCRRNRVPCFLFGDSNILGDVATGWKALLKRVVLPRVIRSCSAVFCCGRLGRDYFLKYGASPEDIFLVPYEPDYDALHGVSPSILNELRERYGLRPDRRYLLYSGRLEAVKRVDLLLEAFTAVSSQRPSWDLVVAGDGALRRQLEAMVPTHLRNRVIWTGFLSDYTLLAGLYRSCDVLVIPSDYEPWGVVVSEAATSMAIVASSAVGAAAELVQDGVNGGVFSQGDARSLAKTLQHATDGTNIEAMKAASIRFLAEWRARADPISGLRQALHRAGLIAASP